MWVLRENLTPPYHDFACNIQVNVLAGMEWPFHSCRNGFNHSSTPYSKEAHVNYDQSTAKEKRIGVQMT